MSGDLPPKPRRLTKRQREIERLRPDMAPAPLSLGDYTVAQLGHMAVVTNPRIYEMLNPGERNVPLPVQAVGRAFRFGIQKLIPEDPDKTRAVLYGLATGKSELGKEVAATLLVDQLKHEHEIGDDEAIPITAAHMVHLLRGSLQRSSEAWSAEISATGRAANRSMSDFTGSPGEYRRWIKPDIRQWFDDERERHWELDQQEGDKFYLAQQAARDKKPH